MAGVDGRSALSQAEGEIEFREVGLVNGKHAPTGLMPILCNAQREAESEYEFSSHQSD